MRRNHPARRARRRPSGPTTALAGRGYPVWVGGSARQVGAVAARADGWNRWGVDAATFATELEVIRSLGAQAGRGAESITPSWGGLVVLDATTSSRAPRALLAVLEPARAVNHYGLFAVMTTRRDELVIEGSLDGADWRAYEFPFKPGAVAGRPRLATPHQPRLDWQMWFAALTTLERAPWVYGLANALLRAEPSVLALIEDPFAGETPAVVRVVRYRYRFTTPEERAWSGDWWIREQIGFWSPEMRLRKPVMTHDPLILD